MNGPEPPDQPLPRNRFRFPLRDLFGLILVAAVLCAWWLDRSQLKSTTELLRMRLEQLQPLGGVEDSAAIAPQATRPSLTSAEFVALVAKDNDWYDLQEALVAFRSSPVRDQAVGDLLNLLASPDKTVRERSLSALAQIKMRGDEVVPAILPLLDDPVRNVQWHAASVLGEFVEEAQAGIPPLRRKMMDDECEIATFAAVTLKKLDSSIDIGPRLVELTRSPIRENRWRAVMHLPDHVSGETAERLLTTLFATEDDSEIRRLIAIALNRLDREQKMSPDLSGSVRGSFEKRSFSVKDSSR